MDKVIYTNNSKTSFQNGDIFDIKQTINGVNKFIILGVVGDWDCFYLYPNNILGRKYEGDKVELINNPDYCHEEIEVVGNIFDIKRVY